MAEITKVYKQNVGAMRFIGKRYGENDRIDGSFGALWGDWFTNGWFGEIEKQIDGHIREIYEDGDAYIGLMRETMKDTFEYWIGIFMPPETIVPDGYDFIDFPAGDLGVCWIYGKENEVYMMEGQCGELLEKEGYDVNTNFCFERYACPRFTTPDEHGNIILDICFFLL